MMHISSASVSHPWGPPWVHYCRGYYRHRHILRPTRTPPALATYESSTKYQTVRAGSLIRCARIHPLVKALSSAGRKLCIHVVSHAQRGTYEHTTSHETHYSDVGLIRSGTVFALGLRLTAVQTYTYQVLKHFL